MSITITGLTELVISWALANAGLPATSEEVNSFLKVTFLIVGALSVWYGRWRLGGVNWWGKRNPPSTDPIA